MHQVKTGLGVEDILRAIVEHVPAPKGDPDAPLQALIFDSVFNPFRGIIAYYKIVNGTIRKGDFVKFVSTGKEYNADEIGVLKLDMSPRQELSAGNVGLYNFWYKDLARGQGWRYNNSCCRPCEMP